MDLQSPKWAGTHTQNSEAALIQTKYHLLFTEEIQGFLPGESPCYPPLCLAFEKAQLKFWLEILPQRV